MWPPGCVLLKQGVSHRLPWYQGASTPLPLQLLLRLQVRSPWAQPQCRRQPPLASSPWRAATAEKAALEAKIAPTAAVGSFQGSQHQGLRERSLLPQASAQGAGTRGGGTHQRPLFSPLTPCHEVGTSKVRGKVEAGLSGGRRHC